jgi:uncharacterized protein (DUF362 family)
MHITPESSMKLYNELVENSKYQIAPVKPKRKNLYAKDGKNRLAIVCCTDRKTGIAEATRILGGIDILAKGVKGEIVIKPNCNTDDVYPRDTHPETIRAIATLLLQSGIKPDQIVIGDMSGRSRGLPTRTTVQNLGITKLAEELGLGLSYFDEEPWVKVKPKEAVYWPQGLVIPKRIYDAERIILTPILRSHRTATFTCAMKLGVGTINAASREWLHDGHDHQGKLIDINTAYNVDLVISDAMKINTGEGMDPKDEVQPGIIIASDNAATNDAAAVALMRYYKTISVVDKPALQHEQFKHAERLKLGSTHLEDIVVKTLDLGDNKAFSEILNHLKTDLN